MILHIILAALVLPNFVISGPLTDGTRESLVLVNRITRETTQENALGPRQPQMKSMHVISNIRNRYARTVVTTQYKNPEDKSQEATFSIVLPDTAFISGFVMEIKGTKYEAYVREKEEAKREYDAAVRRGSGAALVAVSARDSNTFTVSMNVEALSKVTFNLTYEQLLARKHGKYEMLVNLHPGQLVKDLSVDVNINETRRIIHVDTPALRSGNKITESNTATKNEMATISKLNSDGTEVNIRFAPSIQEQKDMSKILTGTDEDKGIAGQFVVEYDVERDPNGGEVIVNDGYFVHFFAPSDQKPIPKNVVFVLDVSGSMHGRKMEQLRQAMKVILGELHDKDLFSLVKFHSTVQVWNDGWQNIGIPSESNLPEPFPANAENIKKAQQTVEAMRDQDMTNIYDALIVALRLTSKGVLNSDENAKQHNPQPMIVFLTDGQSNVGETRTDKMIEMVETRSNKDSKAAIFTLSFGEGASKEFLKELAIKNSGFLRNIYEAADASLQLQDFYKQISSPLLTNVNFKYDDNVKDLTKHNFDILFKGSEFVVAGKIDNPGDKFASIEANTLQGNRKFYPVIYPIVKRLEEKREYGSLERLWAYMTIKQLLDKKYENSNVTESKNEALKIALKYSFVTPVTSLVVVKPNGTDSQPAFADRGQPQQHYSRPDSGRFFLRSGVLRMGGGAYAAPRLSNPSYNMWTASSSDSISFTTPPTSQISELPWLTINGGKITIDNKSYEVGSNATSVDEKPCHVPSLNLSGNCTLLTACPRIYPKLDSLDSYRKYFCTLDSDKYAGVCCIESVN